MTEQYVLDRKTVLFSVFAIVVLVAGTTYLAVKMAQQPIANETVNATNIPKISVSGEAFKQVPPDLLVMEIVVETEKETAAEADAENARMTARLKSALLAAGVQESEISTSYYNTYPVYNDSCYYPPFPCFDDICPTIVERKYERCETEIIGYKTAHSLMIKTERIKSGGVIIDAVSAANASARFDYQYFSLKDETRVRYENELAGLAAQSARSKAIKIAEGLGATLGKIVDIQTNYYYPGPFPYYKDGMQDRTMGEGEVGGSVRAESIATEIFPQDLTLSSSIYVTFEISQ